MDQNEENLLILILGPLWIKRRKCTHFNSRLLMDQKEKNTLILILEPLWTKMKKMYLF